MAASLSSGDISKLQGLDISVVLLSGKSPFDMGSKELCDVNPGVHYLTANFDL